MDSCFGENERAVSPVIGVILMVGISVTLSTTIGVAILAHTNELDNTSPNVRLEITQERERERDSFTIQHSGGESLSGDQLYYTLNGSIDRLNTTNKFDGEVNVGDTAQITLADEETFSDNETFRVIWISESGGHSEILASVQT